jgi:hypothetical protein
VPAYIQQGALLGFGAPTEKESHVGLDGSRLDYFKQGDPFASFLLFAE